MATIAKEVKDRAKVWVTDVEKDMDNLSNRLRRKWGDWYRQYRLFENTQKLPGQSNLFIPKVYEIIEKKAPAVVADKPRFIALPRTNIANENIGVIRDTMGFWWDEDKMQEKSEPFVKDAFIYGISILKGGWHQEMGIVETEEVELDEETGEDVTVVTENKEVLFERPTADLVSIFDIKVDPRVSSFQEGVGVLHYIHDVRYADLLEFDEEMYDLSAFKKMDDADVDANSGQDFAVPEGKTKQEDEGINALGADIDKNKMTLCEMWGVFSESGEAKDEKEYIITTVVVDGMHKFIIRVEENTLGLRPFIKLDDRVIRGEFYSIGEIEPLESLQIEYNNIRNARIDYNNSINYPEWMYNSNANINPAHLVHRPNNIIPIDVPIGQDVRTVLRPVDKPTPPLSGQVEESQINRDFQSISQTVDFTDRGGSKGFDTTATGIKSRDRQTGVQLGNIVSHLESSIAELGMMWLRLAEKFSEDEFVIRRDRIEGDASTEEVPRSETPNKFTKIPIEVLKDVRSNFSLKVEAGSTTADTAEGKAQDAVNIANTAAQFMGLGLPVNLEKVFKDLLKDNFQKANPEEYVKEPEPQIAPGGPQMPPNASGGGKVPLQPSQPNLTPGA